MTVTLLQSATATAETASLLDAQTNAAALAASRATTFVRAQVQWLVRGLNHGGDRIAVGIVLAAHDRSHDRWVATIRQVDDAMGPATAEHISAVYAYVGRVAGSLDKGTMELLPPAVCAQARLVLAERLTDICEQVVESLWQAAASA